MLKTAKKKSRTSSPFLVFHHLLRPAALPFMLRIYLESKKTTWTQAPWTLQKLFWVQDSIPKFHCHLDFQHIQCKQFPTSSESICKMVLWSDRCQIIPLPETHWSVCYEKARKEEINVINSFSQLTLRVHWNKGGGVDVPFHCWAWPILEKGWKLYVVSSSYCWTISLMTATVNLWIFRSEVYHHFILFLLLLLRLHPLHFCKTTWNPKMKKKLTKSASSS